MNTTVSTPMVAISSRPSRRLEVTLAALLALAVLLIF
jgi:hypothetical protein